MKKVAKLILKGISEVNGKPFIKEIHSLNEVKSSGNYIVAGYNASQGNGFPAIAGKTKNCFYCESILKVTCCYSDDESQSNATYGHELTICDRETATIGTYIRSITPHKNNGNWSEWQMVATGNINLVAQNNDINKAFSNLATEISNETTRATTVEQYLQMNKKNKVNFLPDSYNVIKELFIHKELGWNDLFIQMTINNKGKKRFRLANNVDFSDKLYNFDIENESLSNQVIKINDYIYCVLDLSEWVPSSIMHANIEATLKSENSPNCYSFYLKEIERMRAQSAESDIIDTIAGVENSVKVIEGNINGVVGNAIVGYSLDYSGNLIIDEGFAVSNYIDAPSSGRVSVYYANGSAITDKYLIGYDSDGNIVMRANLSNAAGALGIDLDGKVAKFRFTFSTSFSETYPNARTYYMGTNLYVSELPIEGIYGAIDNISSKAEKNSNDIAALNSKVYINRIGKPAFESYFKEILITENFAKDWESIYVRTLRNNLNGTWRIVIGNTSSSENLEYITQDFSKRIDTPIIVGGIYFLMNWDAIPTDVTIHAQINKDIATDTTKNPICYAYSITSKIQLTTDDSPMFALIDDDFTNTEMCEKLAEICEELGIRCTFALIPDYTTDVYTPSMTNEKLSLVQDFQERGFSFAMHPNHNLFYMDGDNSGTLQECEKCLVRTQQFFDKNNIIYGSKILVWPGTSDTRDGGMLVPMAKRHVEIAVHAGTFAGENCNNRENFNGSGRYLMRRQPISFDIYTKSEMKTIIDDFVANGKGLMIFNTHIWEFKDDFTTVDETTSSLPNLKEVLSYAASKGVPFVNMNEAYMRKIQTEYMPSISLK